MFDTTKKLRHSKMRLLEYVPAVQKSLAEKKQKYFHYFENELGEKRDDYIIATAIDGCNQGKQIGAGLQGGGKDVTLINCQHLNFITAANSSALTHTIEAFNCKETHSVIKRAMQEMSNDKTEMKKLSPSVIQMMKCDLKFHCGPLNGNLGANARCGSPYIRQRTDLLTLTKKVVIEFDRDPSNFESIRKTENGEILVCAHFMQLPIWRALQAQNKQYVEKLMKEQPSISKHKLKEKLYDFAVSNGTGLCADVIAECKHMQNPEDESSMYI